MQEKVDLKVDWATHEAAKYACEHYHYSQCLPFGKLVKIAAWEDGNFIEVVVFGRGATPNLGKPYNLSQTQCIELVRIALTRHKTFVSKIMMAAINMIKQKQPGLKLIVSFADVNQGHNGAIYQATNWIYTGTTESKEFYVINGKLKHPRSIGSLGHTQNIEGAKKIDKNATSIIMQGKHRYLMPLDKKMKKQIEPLRKPYPKKQGAIDGGSQE